MKLFYLKNKKSLASKFNLSIDPGVKSSGLCLLDLDNSTVVTKTILNKEAYANVIFPHLYCLSLEMFDQYLLFIEENKVDIKKTTLNIEYTFSQGSFSPGLNAQVATAITKFIDLGIQGIYFVPPRIPSFFLRTVERLDDHILNAWFVNYVPRIKLDSPHSKDALMISIFCNYDFFFVNNLIDTRIRKPEYELKEIKWQRKKNQTKT